MTRNCKSLLMLLALALFTAGCSVQGQVTDIGKKINIITAGSAQDFLASSTQGETTSGGYKVWSSSGARIAPVVGNSLVETTSGGYKVYVTVQGNNSSETIATITQ